jgi:segregation and condensation protein A
MRDAGEMMMNVKLLGRDFFARGAPEKFSVTLNTVLDANLHDLMRAYGDMKRRHAPTSMTIEAIELYTVDLAIARIRSMLGATPEWRELWQFLPTDITNPLIRRSAIAATFTASLELAREGKLDIRQTDTFGRIYITAKQEDGLDYSEDQTENNQNTDNTNDAEES